MATYFHLLGLELRYRWFILLIPAAYLFLLPGFRHQQSALFALTMTPGFFFIFQNAIMLVPLFQNTPWGIANGRQPSLEFAFSRAINRRSLFWVKASMYLVGSALFGLTFLLYALIRPEIKITVYDTPGRFEASQAFYLESFPDARQEIIPPASDRKYEIILPRGQIAVALAILVLCVGFGVFYQLLMSFLPETKLANVAAVSIAFIAIISIPLWSSYVTLSRVSRLLQGDFSTRPASDKFAPSLYEGGVALVGQHPIEIFAVLALATVAIELICCHRFVQKEIL